MSEEISPQALARKQRFIDEKLDAGGFDSLVEKQETRAKRVFFDERGDIMSICHNEPHEVNPLWLTYNFDQHVINELDDKDVNKFIEIGPGKVLSGLVKRVSKEVQVSSINNEEDIKNIKI